NIGGTLGRLLAGAGHQVVLANSRGPESLAGLVAEIGPAATASTPAGAAEAGEVVVVAIPFLRYPDLPAAELSGKIVVDATNYYEGRDGPFPGGESSSEVVAAALAGATVVKAFNTIHYRHLANDGVPAGTPGRRAIPIAGDDAAAKDTVAGLIDEIGFDTYDVGSLADGRRMEPGTPLFNVALTRDEVAAALA
ncbi:MAG TPA: NADPH-dependent F420 reductase, partial [Acidimicrobiales bacterium]|nr:NADPH-dependent F420 reductase [Acidimicrobiales bacterium]